MIQFKEVPATTKKRRHVGGEENTVNCACGTKEDLKDNWHLLRACHALGTCAKCFTCLCYMLLIAVL